MSLILFFFPPLASSGNILIKDDRWRTYRNLDERSVAESRDGEPRQDGPVAVVFAGHGAQMLRLPVGQHPAIERVI